MRHLDFLVPSVLVAPAFAGDLLRDQSLPHLGRLLGHGTRADPVEHPAHASLTSWQSFVFCERAGLVADHVNLAELWAIACGVPPSPGAGRYVAEPAHFKIANDHLRLDDPRALGITFAEARTLSEAIEPLLLEAGWHLDPVGPATLTHWMLHRDDGLRLSAAAIERAINDNVASWQPRSAEVAHAGGRSDDGALAWRRCVNEIQMLWFGHPVNEAREARGLATINTLWLSGNGGPGAALPHYAAVDSSLSLLAALPLDPDATVDLESFDGFVAPSRREDWSTWREQLAALDARLGEILDRQRAGRCGTLTATFCGGDRVKVVTLAPRDTAKFWRGWRGKPSMVDFLAEGGA